MKLIINVPAKFLEEIRKYVNEGRYSRVEDFIEVALYNQMNLEGEESTDSIKLWTSSPIDISPVLKSSEESLGEFSLYNLLDKEHYLNIKTVKELVYGGSYEEPLWGQYNRIFPIKLTLRILVNLLTQENGSIDLAQFTAKSSSVARGLGLELLDIDTTKKRTRGSRISTALPIGKDSYKSKNRYMNHFIGYVDSNSLLWGAPAHLQFLTIMGDSNTHLCITKAGLDFALLSNPVLDDNKSSNKTLSDEEIEYYINHIYSNIKGEADINSLILQNISKENNRPSGLTKTIQENYKNMTNSQANTIRSGLISRMYELNLLNRKRLGLREIYYELTDRGNKLLDSILDDQEGE